MDKRPTVYFVDVFSKVTPELREVANVIQLDITLKPGGFEPENYVVPALEAGEVADQVEILFADLAVLTRYHRRLKNLKWAHTGWNGVDGLTKTLDPTQPAPPFVLTKALGTLNAPYIAEYVMGYVIAHAKAFFRAREAQKAARWTLWDLSQQQKTVSTMTIGIMGVGLIGKQVAAQCKTMGMTVWGLTRRSPSKDHAFPHVDVYKTMDELAEFLQQCDYVCNILPSTRATRNLLSGDVLKNCQQKKAVFINVGRGDIIDEATVVNAINSGWLGGAVLDVFETEPLPSTSALWSLPGVTITPHISGWCEDSTHVEVNAGFLPNLKRYLSGEALQGVLDWNQEY